MLVAEIMALSLRISRCVLIHSTLNCQSWLRYFTQTFTSTYLPDTLCPYPPQRKRVATGCPCPRLCLMTAFDSSPTVTGTLRKTALSSLLKISCKNTRSSSPP